MPVKVLCSYLPVTVSAQNTQTVIIPLSLNCEFLVIFSIEIIATYMHIRYMYRVDYDMVRERQKERKQAEIKDKIMKFTFNVFSNTGLIPTNFILKSPVGGTVVDLGLCLVSARVAIAIR